MNQKILELAKQCGYWSGQTVEMNDVGINKFAALVLEECRKVLTEEYQKTPIECSGHLLRLDEEMLDHFYGVSKDEREN